MAVVDRIIEHGAHLTATERKIAEVLSDEPQTIAFGTVAQVARRAGTSGPSVVRLAVKLGYGGFVDLQADVQHELASQLGPARERIRQRPEGHLVDRVLATEQHNVARTLKAIDPESLDRALTLLDDVDRQVWILPGEVISPVGIALADQLGQLRGGVTKLSGSEVAISRGLAGLRPGDLLIVIDIRRYERSILKLTRWAAGRGAWIIAITDSPLSPLAPGATETFFIAAQGVGPFDSMIGGLAMVNVLIAGLAIRLRRSAPSRLDTVEAGWNATRALVGDPVGPGPDEPGPDEPTTGRVLLS